MRGVYSLHSPSGSAFSVGHCPILEPYAHDPHAQLTQTKVCSPPVRRCSPWSGPKAVGRRAAESGTCMPETRMDTPTQTTALYTQRIPRFSRDSPTPAGPRSTKRKLATSNTHEELADMSIHEHVARPQSSQWRRRPRSRIPPNICPSGCLSPLGFRGFKGIILRQPV